MPLHSAQTVLQKNLPRLLREAGYPTMELFAHENGIEKSTLSRIMTGSRDPRLATLDRIRHALDISWASLLEESSR